MSSEIKSRKGVCPPPLLFSSSERELAEGKEEEEENKLTLGKLTFRIRGEGERMDSLRGRKRKYMGSHGRKVGGGEGLLLHWATLRCIALISVASSYRGGGGSEFGCLGFGACCNKRKKVIRAGKCVVQPRCLNTAQYFFETPQQDTELNERKLHF